MKLVTITFTENERNFDSLIEVWKKSAAYYMPDVEAVVLKIGPPENKKRACDKYMRYSSTYAFLKMALWALKQKDDLILMDCDTFFTGPCQSAFQEGFDLAGTVRDAPCWLNGGVVFVRNSFQGKALLNEVIQLIYMICRRPERFEKELKHFLGADQAALAMLVEEGSIAKLPCEVWNCEQHSWDKFSEDTRIVHMKSSLWDLVQGDEMRSKYEEGHNIFKIFDLWKIFLEGN